MDVLRVRHDVMGDFLLGEQWLDYVGDVRRRQGWIGSDIIENLNPKKFTWIYAAEIISETAGAKALGEMKYYWKNYMVRIQLELPEDRVAELDELMRSLRLRTRKDLLNTAITLLEWAASEKSAGHKIASVDVDQQVLRELVMPGLESLTKRNPDTALATK